MRRWLPDQCVDMSVPNNRQRGAALILMMFIITLATMAYVMKSFDADSMQASHEEKTYQVLAEAKEVLIGWAVSHRYTPGQMPWPDRNGDGNYDGSSDCAANSFSVGLFLGQLPSRPATSPCRDPNTGMTIYAGLSTYPNLGQEFNDAYGNRLWYAVSRNLVRNHLTSSDPVINPGIINNPTYQWLKVFDHDGKLLSDRVAVVIIAPGRALANQNRSAIAPAANAFLDTVTINGTSFSNSNYDADNEDFVMGGDDRSNSFNDQLVYITIDELIAALEIRAANEAKAALNVFFVNSAALPESRFFPYAAIMGGAGSGGKYRCMTGNPSGALPVDVARSCSYAVGGSSVTVSCNFEDVTSIRYIASGSFSANSGACTFSGNTCSCSGEGSCSGMQTFTCDDLGACSSNGTGGIEFVGGNFTTRAGGCSLGAADACSKINTASCSTLSGTVGFDCAEVLPLPSWFTTNRWQDFIHYAMARDGSPTWTSGAGTQARTGISALVVTTGRAITGVPFATAKNAAQVRPSCDLKDYLDTVENTDLNNVYEARGKQKTLNYNDRVFVVAP